ncbi:hypothetical protein [Klebsiella phage ZCKP8]|uniref:EaA-like protein n=2 Tax=unclassified Caudoviricetes TaxID=2788787 RepID=UPI001CE70586|nr:hypothetical protein PRB87_gp05 [Klebsiella phage ZCKP8]YP_010685667.1 EaA-like protein [Klebsiella phage vB_Kpn_ZC2]QYW02880.1 hypothetical protein [Klebsiella phage ZCKP8]UZN98646.1 EaA-like protein [Klebsiella phage vB_Kpn_ZC2]
MDGNNHLYPSQTPGQAGAANKAGPDFRLSPLLPPERPRCADAKTGACRMTTDITELAQSLKAAAEKYKSVWGIARYSKAVEAREKFHELVTPSNVLALVEALEKAQQRIAELESRTVTVKLPYTPEPSAFAPWLAKAFYQFHKDTVKSCVAVFSDACAAAGIKVEDE